MKKLVWSGLGFSLLITAMTIQYYFLCNATFGWANLEEGNNRNQFAQVTNTVSNTTDNEVYYRFALSQSAGGNFGNSILEAFKASMSNIVAFSMVLGRAGLL